jgi:dCTP deaminase
MFLSDIEINALVQKRRIIIEPFNQNLLRPASYLLRLSNTFVRFKALDLVDVLDSESIKSNASDVIREDSIVIYPHELLLASSIEKIGIPDDLVGLIEGISHLGRIGLVIHSTSPLINPGFGWHTLSSITFELFSYNPAPIKLYSGMPICHLLFARLGCPASQGYDEKSSVYTGQDQPELSRYYQEFKRFVASSGTASSQL